MNSQIGSPNSSFRNARLEDWARSVVDRVSAGQSVEDSRVELKRDWPSEHDKTARRLAGHANAARGSDIIWLIGVDEKDGVVGASAEELANWWPQVQKRFDGPTPELLDMAMTYDGKSVVAMFFSTTRAPYVVKTSQNPVTYEVPWRDGTRVRSARRSDLLALLVEQIEMPEVEFLRGYVSRLHPMEEGARGEFSRMRASAQVGIFVTPPRGIASILVYHRCSALIAMPQLTHPIEGEVEGGMPYTKYAGGFLHSSATSVGASIADDCVRFNDPGKVTLLLTFMVPKVQDPYPTKARLSVDIAFAHLDRPYRLNLVVDQDCLTTSDEFPLKMEQEL